MKDYALELAGAQSGTNAKLNALREYLQAYLLRVGHDQGLFDHTAFIGGTALRFVYDLPRFSEDIDLSLERKRGFSFARVMRQTTRELQDAGYQVTVAMKTEQTVQRALVRFEGLLYEANIAPVRAQKLSIRMEVDTRPPRGAFLQTEIINKFFPVALLTYDLPSLFAGKLNALLCRRYTKGRDYFDLAWYLSRWRDLTPNVRLLRNGLKQVHWQQTYPTVKNWRDVLSRAVANVNWRTVTTDVEPLLDRPADMQVFTQDNVLNLVRGR